MRKIPDRIEERTGRRMLSRCRSAVVFIPSATSFSSAAGGDDDLGTDRSFNIPGLSRICVLRGARLEQEPEFGV